MDLAFHKTYAAYQATPRCSRRKHTCGPFRSGRQGIKAANCVSSTVLPSPRHLFINTMAVKLSLLMVTLFVGFSLAVNSPDYDDTHTFAPLSGLPTWFEPGVGVREADEQAKVQARISSMHGQESDRFDVARKKLAESVRQFHKRSPSGRPSGSGHRSNSNQDIYGERVRWIGDQTHADDDPRFNHVVWASRDPVNNLLAVESATHKGRPPIVYTYKPPAAQPSTHSQPPSSSHPQQNRRHEGHVAVPNPHTNAPGSSSKRGRPREFHTTDLPDAQHASHHHHEAVERPSYRRMERDERTGHELIQASNDVGLNNVANAHYNQLVGPAVRTPGRPRGSYNKHPTPTQ